MRSFAERDLGPHDGRGNPLGGEFYTIFNVEYTFPLYGELLGAVFVDAGNLLPEAGYPSLDDMRYGIGLGLRYNLPIGPIGIDYGVNPARGRTRLSALSTLVLASHFEWKLGPLWVTRQRGPRPSSQDAVTPRASLLRD